MTYYTACCSCIFTFAGSSVAVQSSCKNLMDAVKDAVVRGGIAAARVML